MLAVKRLFKRDTTANTIHSVLYEEISPPSTHRAQVPPELDRIVMKALARDPKDRWPTAREMGRALRGFLGAQTEIVGPAELSEWMSEVFPQGEARKSQLMEIARMASTSLPSMPQANDVDGLLTANRRSDRRSHGGGRAPAPVASCLDLGGGRRARACRVCVVCAPRERGARSSRALRGSSARYGISSRPRPTVAFPKKRSQSNKRNQMK